jgi:hypothetical protein
MVIMVVSLSGWLGTVQEHIVLEMEEVVLAQECNDLRH